jgi:hypothetical protein
MMNYSYPSPTIASASVKIQSVSIYQSILLYELKTWTYYFRRAKRQTALNTGKEGDLVNKGRGRQREDKTDT